MHLIFMVFAVLLVGTVLFNLFRRTPAPSLPRSADDWGAGLKDDPRVAIAAMMYAVAAEVGPLTGAEERQILSLLSSKVGLEPRLASQCLDGGQRMARGLDGDLTSRLHQLLAPIARKCTDKEKQDVIEMLNVIAGSRAERLGPVREGLGRVASSLLHG